MCGIQTGSMEDMWGAPCVELQDWWRTAGGHVIHMGAPCVEFKQDRWRTCYTHEEHHVWNSNRIDGGHVIHMRSTMCGIQTRLLEDMLYKCGAPCVKFKQDWWRTCYTHEEHHVWNSNKIDGGHVIHMRSTMCGIQTRLMEDMLYTCGAPCVKFKQDRWRTCYTHEEHHVWNSNRIDGGHVIHMRSTMCGIQTGLMEDMLYTWGAPCVEFKQDWWRTCYAHEEHHVWNSNKIDGGQVIHMRSTMCGIQTGLMEDMLYTWGATCVEFKQDWWRTCYTHEEHHVWNSNRIDEKRNGAMEYWTRFSYVLTTIDVVGQLKLSIIRAKLVGLTIRTNCYPICKACEQIRKKMSMSMKRKSTSKN